ncbi:hypothetical protein [Acinetobacter radioresistens]|uniref:hypothetical protein n=1 Tax=Acinetobacter radioresistens TaxID=40216 RepID=UPI000EDC0B51|nr:hypothetical protein [Acinetobacter radioresistens]MCX0334821.1 hypothetical protein [Acinetobacter radioresistens]HAD68907.1 hypothetical protein [Acinetobacter radioresistens]
MKIKMMIASTVLSGFTACSAISPIFVDYNGVRMDVAKWINHQQLLSMQQKRSLAQLSRAQQKLYRIDEITESQKLSIAQENQIALHCARQYLSEKKITQLQEQVFGKDQRQQILNTYTERFPQIKLDTGSITCD